MVSAWSRTALPFPPLLAGLGQVSGGNGKYGGNWGSARGCLIDPSVPVSHWELECRKVQRFLDLYHHPHLSIHPLYWVCWWYSKGVAGIACTMQLSTAVKLGKCFECDYRTEVSPILQWFWTIQREGYFDSNHQYRDTDSTAGAEQMSMSLSAIGKGI